jgi:hypothetical protein
MLNELHLEIIMNMSYISNMRSKPCTVLAFV